MRYPSWFRSLAGCSLLLGLAGCMNTSSKDNKEEHKGPLLIYTVNYPLAYFAERIGGEHVQVVFPAPKEDPAFWIPDAKTVAAYQKADLILLNGANYAKWLNKVSLPLSKLCNTSVAFQSEYITIKDAVTHSHGPGGTHSHEGTAFTTWIDPRLAIQQAQAIQDKLAKRRPAHKQTFRTNFEELKKDLESLDQRIEKIVAQARTRPLVFSHPVYQYLIRRYQLNAKSVHWEPDEVPTAKQWKELDDLLAKHPAKWMIWEGEPQKETSEGLQQRGVQSVVFDPCANRPEKGDYLEVMDGNIDNLTRVFAATE
jgi:zinc transport system substrate-binding protein